MNNHNINLSYIINGIDRDKFLADYWEKKVLYIERNDEHYYDIFFEKGMFNYLMSQSNYSWGEVQLANHNKSPVWNDYSKLTPNLVTLNLAYQQGDTIILNDLQNKVETLTMLCNSIAEEFNYFSNVNLYLTKNGEQGLSPHFDNEDVFILQISGNKLWKIYNGTCLPLSDHGALTSKIKYGEAQQEITMSSGDMLYIPRGVGHAAVASERTPSMHLTLSITVVRIINIISTMLDLVSKENKELRKAVPLQMFYENKNNDIQDKIKNILYMVGHTITTDLIKKAINQHKANLIGSLRPINDSFICEQSNDIDINSSLKKRRGVVLHYCHEGEEIQVTFPGGSFTANPSLLPVIKHIAENEKFSISSLPVEGDVEKKTAVVYELIKQGIICGV